MVRHDPPNRVVTDPTPWRYVVLVALLSVVLLGGGVAMAVGVVVVKAGSAAKAERLGRDGVEVRAVLSGYRAGRKLSSTVWLNYEYAGRTHRVRVECDDRQMCDPARSYSLPIRVDPANPDDLVTTLGVTDDSTSWLDSWARLVHAAIVIAVGVVSALLWRGMHRQAREERRLASRRRSPEPED